MHHLIVRALCAVLSAVLPSRGRHRASATPTHAPFKVTSAPIAAPAAPTPTPVPPVARRAPETPLRGEDIGLVRPYVTLLFERRERQAQDERRTALALATIGIDVGPRVIHGVRLPA